jgi:DNA polymerase III subunit chi
VGTVLFYHLTRSTLEVTARTLLARSFDLGWRVVVRGRSAGLLDGLDRALWLGPEDEFLPHGRAGGAHDARQPILLTETTTLPDRCNALMVIEGADVLPAEVAGLERVWILFEGGDEAAVERARGQWKTLSDLGIGAQYWAEDESRWTKKMERPAGGGSVPDQR